MPETHLRAEEIKALNEKTPRKISDKRLIEIATKVMDIEEKLAREMKMMDYLPLEGRTAMHFGIEVYRFTAETIKTCTIYDRYPRLSKWTLLVRALEIIYLSDGNTLSFY